MRTISHAITAVSLALCLGGCGDQPPAADQPAEDKGRPETRNLEAAGAVGYDGHGIRRSVDRMLDARDKQNQDLKKAMAGEDGREDEDP